MEEAAESAAVLDAPEVTEMSPDAVVEDGVDTTPSDVPEGGSAPVETPSGITAAEEPPPAVSASPDEDSGPPAAQRENVLRGILFALPVIPVGVVIWAVIWDMGYMASLVMFVVSAGAAFLYRKGSGGRIGYAGLAVILVLTVVTLVLSFLGGMVTDFAHAMEMPLGEALGSGRFWAVFRANVTGNPELGDIYGGDIAWAVLFAALGTYGTIRGVLREARSHS